MSGNHVFDHLGKGNIIILEHFKFYLKVSLDCCNIQKDFHDKLEFQEDAKQIKLKRIKNNK